MEGGQAITGRPQEGRGRRDIFRPRAEGGRRNFGRGQHGVLEPSRHMGDRVVGRERVWSVTYSIGAGHACHALEGLVEGYVGAQYPYKRITR